MNLVPQLQPHTQIQGQGELKTHVIGLINPKETSQEISAKRSRDDRKIANQNTVGQNSNSEFEGQFQQRKKAKRQRENDMLLHSSSRKQGLNKGGNVVEPQMKQELKHLSGLSFANASMRIPSLTLTKWQVKGCCVFAPAVYQISSGIPKYTVENLQLNILFSRW